MNPFISIQQQDPFAAAMGANFQGSASAAPPSYAELMERQAKLKRLGLDDTALGAAGNLGVESALKRQQMKADAQTWIGRQMGTNPSAGESSL